MWFGRDEWFVFFFGDTMVRLHYRFDVMMAAYIDSGDRDECRVR